MRLLNLRINFLFIADFLSSSWYFFFFLWCCFFFHYVSAKFHQLAFFRWKKISPLAFFRWKKIDSPKNGYFPYVSVVFSFNQTRVNRSPSNIKWVQSPWCSTVPPNCLQSCLPRPLAWRYFTWDFCRFLFVIVLNLAGCYRWNHCLIRLLDVLFTMTICRRTSYKPALEWQKKTGLISTL